MPIPARFREGPQNSRPMPSALSSRFHKLNGRFRRLVFARNVRILWGNLVQMATRHWQTRRPTSVSQGETSCGSRARALNRRSQPAECAGVRWPECWRLDKRVASVESYNSVANVSELNEPGLPRIADDRLTKARRIRKRSGRNWFASFGRWRRSW